MLGGFHSTKFIVQTTSYIYSEIELGAKMRFNEDSAMERTNVPQCHVYFSVLDAPF